MASPETLTESSWEGQPPPLPSGYITEEEFVAWCPEKVRAEWIDGEVIIMAPASTPHGLCITWLGAVLTAFVEKRGLGEVHGPEVMVRLPRVRRRRLPDLAFVADARREIIQQNHIEGPPDLVVEIVSPDSVSRDWRDKYHDYEKAGVREYWVIDLSAQRAEVYILNTEANNDEGALQEQTAKYTRIEEQEGVLRSVVLPDFWLRTEWLWPEGRPTLLATLRELGLV